ncbi:hypothetical protein JJB11_02780 [Ramlibacter ginsenosidimutans]|uniref:Uncharacterized protein n=1 Tax=Ramlibacter ginsenosidimutans TaxID=502333 RepID=A0A934TPC5_9BURK|nr:hypothetical protein [Ramlibacter ginsenosidimutans]MBK6005007.1 hypothetical protein [Ramlibacter ginsenosidimutans]
MPLLQDQTDAFIVRVWCEPNRARTPPFEWRGSIEHVESGRRAYFRDAAAIAAFIQPYIDQLLASQPAQP